MRIEPISRDRRRNLSDEFEPGALALLSGAQRRLLVHWLKGKSQKPKWDTLLKLAFEHGGQECLDIAESLAQSLAECGAAILEQRFERSVWKNIFLVWRDYEGLNAELGLTTPAARRALFMSEWNASQDLEWRSSRLAEAFQRLKDMPPDQARSRLALICKLNDWLAAGKTGTRYAFSLYGFGQTKHEITQGEWAWLEENVGLAECGIQQHAPALWIAGDIQFRIGDRWLDAGAACDAIALSPASLDKLSAASSAAACYRLIENRTSFEHLSRTAHSRTAEIVIWLPGYAPSWWRTAVGRLLDVFPLPARFSCDADPDGVQIAIQAAKLWSSRHLNWQPYEMDASLAAASPHKLRMSERDMRLAGRLLVDSELPPELAELLSWCIQSSSKAEQENWIGCDLS